MNFKFKMSLLIIFSLSLFNMSFGMKILNKASGSFDDIDSIAQKVTFNVHSLLNKRGFTSKNSENFAWKVYDGCHNYIGSKINLLKNIFRGNSTEDIAYGIYRYSDLDNCCEDKRVIISSIEKALKSFKRRSLKATFLTAFSKLSKVTLVGSSILLSWGLYTGFIERDRIGFNYAKNSFYVLGGTYILKKIMNFMH
ncbi:hypothetical protein GF385_04085 [Candidatus Dependentiae bacterium]|nr:hypothetical protein [Candidatus Dependentiae bacterium]